MTARRPWMLLLGVLVVGCVPGPLPGSTPASPGPPPPGAIGYPMPGPPYPPPGDDVFLRQPAPVRLAGMAAGAVIRYRPIAPRAYRLGHVPARAWQFVYRSTDTQGTPVANVATLLVPPHPRSRLLSYQVAYDALNPICAPSQEIVRGTMIEQHFVSKALRRGWPVLLPDHEGPAMAYMAGRNAGFAVLDGLRAVQTFVSDDLIDTTTPIALWGYSGGAYATLWAGQMAPTRAPELPIAAIAAGAPPPDLLAIGRHLDGGPFAGIYFQAMFGLARAYPSLDLDRLLDDRGQAVRDRLSRSCLGQELAWVRDPLLSGLGFADMDDYVTTDDLLAVPRVHRVAAANRLGEASLPAPLFYYQGWFDPLIPRDQARALARRYCDRGVPVDFAWALGGHLLAAITRADDALDFLENRLSDPHSDRPMASDCADIRTRWPAVAPPR